MSRLSAASVGGAVSASRLSCIAVALDVQCIGDTNEAPMSGCIHPVTRRHGDTNYRTRCGKCRYCRLRHKLSWTGRLVLESKEHLDNRFLTLTYEDAPEFLVYKDIQLFLKKYRKDRPNLRFCAVGEYGETKGRAHWHLLTFNDPTEEKGKVLLDEWDHGHAFIGSVTRESIGYVAGYSLKGAKLSQIDKSKRPVSRFSNRPGIGANMLELLGERYAQARRNNATRPLTYSITGKRYPLEGNGLKYFERGYLKAGGQPFLALSQDEQNIKTALEIEEFYGGPGFQNSKETAQHQYNELRGRKVRLPNVSSF